MSKESEIKISWTDKGKKFGATGILLTMASGLGSFITASVKDRDKVVYHKPKIKEERVIKLEIRQENLIKGFNRIHDKLDNLNETQKVILQKLK